MQPWFTVLLAIAFATLPAHAGGVEGKRAPAFSLADAAGARRSLEDVALGRPAVVVFWATWCPYCKALLPHLERMSQQYRGRIAVVAINVWDEPDVDPYAWMRERGHEFTVLGRGDRAAKAWGVKGTPGLFVVDDAGVVAFDRSARPFAPSPPDASLSGVPDRRTSTERSAALWAAAVADALERLLPGEGAAAAD